MPRITAGAIAATLTLNAVRARRRVTALPVLDEHALAGDVAGYRLVAADGVHVTPATLAAAVAHARPRRLQVLDLVPADLPAERLLALLGQLDPATYAGDVLATGRTAGHALVVSAELLERTGIEPRTDLGELELTSLAVTLKEHAPTRCAHALAPGLRARTARDGSWERLRRAYGESAWIALIARVAGLVLLLRGARRGPLGVAALAAYQAQPLLVTAGTAARPRGRWRDLLGRAPARLADALLTARSGLSASDAGAEIEARRSAYPEVAEGVDRLLEERRDDCPICGGTSLERHTEVPDLLQGKPGRFTVDRCRRCHTLFQNPRLSLGGLDFYYRDFYDGLSGEWMAEVFSGSRESYQGRVDLIGAHTTPRRLLDVGTGQGHFCLVARETWPETVLDGLDFTPNVDLAERRGRIDHAFNGLFPELAPKLEDRYDVVTMHHYLEHTRDPAAELAAAALVVTPGGYLEIEVPNPDTWIGRRFGGYWLPLLQPQHQQLIPLARLRTMLREHGFSPVTAQLAEAHQPVDLGGAAYLLLNRLAPAGDVPWADPPGRLRRMARPVVVAALFPMVLAGFLLDRLLAPVLAHGGAASAYRVIARRDGGLDDA